MNLQRFSGTMRCHEDYRTHTRSAKTISLWLSQKTSELRRKRPASK